MSNVKYKYVHDGVIVLDADSHKVVYAKSGPKWFVDIFTTYQRRKQNWRVIQIINAVDWNRVQHQ